MKFIPFKIYEQLNTRDFLSGIVKTSPAGQTVGEMRVRLKVLNALTNAPPDGVQLEDAQHATLLKVLNSRDDFGITSADVVAIVDDVVDAKEPPQSSEAGA